MSISRWPKHDENKIDLKLEAQEDLVEKVVYDIKAIIELTKINPKKVQIFVSAPWKYVFYRKLKEQIKHTRVVSQLIEKTKDNDHMDQIPKLIQDALKDQSKIPEIVLDQETEIYALTLHKHIISSRLGLEIEILKEQDSSNPKAKSALASKPAILLL